MIIIGVLAGSDDEGKASLQDLLKFCTGLDNVPPIGLAHLIQLEYMNDRSVSPTVSACYCILRLPSATDEETFFHNIDIGILGRKNHFHSSPSYSLQ